MRYNYPGFRLGEPFANPRSGEKGGFHGGTDYLAAAGTPVHALFGGKVFRSGYVNGYGMTVIVETNTPNGRGLRPGRNRRMRRRSKAPPLEGRPRKRLDTTPQISVLGKLKL